MNKAAAMLEHGASAAEVLKHFLRKGRPPSLQGHWPAKNRNPARVPLAVASRVQRAREQFAIKSHFASNHAPC